MMARESESQPDHIDIALWVLGRANGDDAPIVQNELLGMVLGLDLGIQLALRHPEYAVALTQANRAITEGLEPEMLDDLVRSHPLEARS